MSVPVKPVYGDNNDVTDKRSTVNQQLLLSRKDSDGFIGNNREPVEYEEDYSTCYVLGYN